MTKEEIANRNKLHLVCDEVPSDFKPKRYGDYEQALEAAGVKVLDFKSFGSYQGEWWAKVQFPNDEIYFVPGYYGSCSGCDAFEGEFGWSDRDKENYPERLKNFGRDYLTDCYTLEQAIEYSSRNLEWDTDAEEMVTWLKGHAE